MCKEIYNGVFSVDHEENTVELVVILDELILI
jgi:hypothetical protein